MSASTSLNEVSCPQVRTTENTSEIEGRSKVVRVKKKVKVSTAICYRPHADNSALPEPNVTTEVDETSIRDSGAFVTATHHTAVRDDAAVDESNGRFEFELSQIGSEECRNSKQSFKKVSVVCHPAAVDRYNSISASTSAHEVSYSEVPVLTTKTASETQFVDINRQSNVESRLRTDSKSADDRRSKKKKVSTAIFDEPQADSCAVPEHVVPETYLRYSDTSESICHATEPCEAAGFVHLSDVQFHTEPIGSGLHVKRPSQGVQHNAGTVMRPVDFSSRLLQK